MSISTKLFFALGSFLFGTIATSLNATNPRLPMETE